MKIAKDYVPFINTVIQNLKISKDILRLLNKEDIDKLATLTNSLTDTANVIQNVALQLEQYGPIVHKQADQSLYAARRQLMVARGELSVTQDELAKAKSRAKEKKSFYSSLFHHPRRRKTD